MELYEKLKAEISLDNIYKDMAYLIDEVGERLSGSKEMEKATEYICKRHVSDLPKSIPRFNAG